MRGYVFATICILSLVQGLALTNEENPQKIVIRLGIDGFLKDLSLIDPKSSSHNENMIVKTPALDNQGAIKLEETNTAETNPAATSTSTATESGSTGEQNNSNSTSSTNSTQTAEEPQPNTLIYGIYADIVIVVLILTLILVSVVRNRSSKAPQEPGYSKVPN